MYISGQVWDFMQRLHQLPTTTGELNSFLIEGRGYLKGSGILPTTSGQWELEARVRKWMISGDPSVMTQQQF